MCLCVDYGGQVELPHAARGLARQATAGKINPGRIDEKRIRTCLYQPDMPDVDLLIRTSVEQRVSNFLTWQSAYAKMSFPSALWPDFSHAIYTRPYANTSIETVDTGSFQRSDARRFHDRGDSGASEERQLR